VPSIGDRTNGLKKIDGYVPLYWDERTGSMFLEISRLDADFLFTTGCRLVSVERHRPRSRPQRRRPHRPVPAHGPRVMLIEATSRFDPAARIRSNANPSKILREVDPVGFAVAAESGGRVLVDATDFLLRDVTGRPVAAAGDISRRSHAQRLLPAEHQELSEEHRDRHDADFAVEASGGARRRLGPRRDRRRSAPARRRRRLAASAARLFSGSVASVTPSAEAVTLREHVSFVELPPASSARR